MNNPEWHTGLKYLKKPLWPLVKLYSFLYLATLYKTWEALLHDLPLELNVNGISYKTPAARLKTINWPLPWPDILKGRHYSEQLLQVIDSYGNHLDIMRAMFCHMKQHILQSELETINSLLCPSMACSLCCEGPKANAIQEFFEIPLTKEELYLFSLEVIDTTPQGDFTPYSSQSFQMNGRPFYCLPPAIYRWSSGHSLILTKGTSCPHPSLEGRYNIYLQRPDVYRRPQIFAYVTEALPNTPLVRKRNTLLAITDCPYLRLIEKEVESYANLNEVILVLKPNKA
jgi:hypothetical protein